MPVRGGVYPGWWGRWVGWGGLYRVLPSTLQDLDLVIFQALDPTYGQMKAIQLYSMRFLRYDLRMTSELTRYDPRMTSQVTLQTGPRWPSDPHMKDLRYPMV